MDFVVFDVLDMPRDRAESDAFKPAWPAARVFSSRGTKDACRERIWVKKRGGGHLASICIVFVLVYDFVSVFVHVHAYDIHELEGIGLNLRVCEVVATFFCELFDASV